MKFFLYLSLSVLLLVLCCICSSKIYILLTLFNSILPQFMQINNSILPQFTQFNHYVYINSVCQFACTRASTCLQTKLIIRNFLHQIYINFILFCSSLHRCPDSVSHMGVDITTWRQRLRNSGIFSQKDPYHCSFGSFMRINVRYGSASLRLCAALAIQLFMAGIKINP